MHLFYRVQSLTNLNNNENQKRKIFVLLRQTPWSALNFWTCFVFLWFWESFNSIRDRFCQLNFCWNFNYTIKSQQEKWEGWKSKNLWFFSVNFKTKNGGVHSIYKTVFIEHVQEIGLCYHIPLGRWCIGSI